MSMTASNRQPPAPASLCSKPRWRASTRMRSDSIRSNAEMAGRIGASTTRDRRLLLIGMGASHYANRIVEPLYRRLGIEAWALTAAELMQTPPPAPHGRSSSSRNRVESGEIVELLKNGPDNQHRSG